MTRRVEGLEQLVSHEWLKLSPEDARLFDIEDGEWVNVSSRRGQGASACDGYLPLGRVLDDLPL
ncbi:MAG TPA: hypothetical protein DEH25_00660 [Chloroflexi bacterium]|nr:hypothetical protein [Chloroflexota bacterium]